MIDIKWTKYKRIDNLVNQVGKLDGQDTSYGYFKEQGYHPESPHLTYAELMAIHELRPASDPMRRPVFEVSLRKRGGEFKKHNLNLVKEFVDNSAIIRKPTVSTLLSKIAMKGIEITKPTFGDTSLIKPNTLGVAKSKGRNSPMVEFGILKEALAYKTSLRKTIKKFN